MVRILVLGALRVQTKDPGFDSTAMTGHKRHYWLQLSQEAAMHDFHYVWNEPSCNVRFSSYNASALLEAQCLLSIVWVGTLTTNLRFLKLLPHVRMKRIYEAKMEESEKAVSHLCSTYRGLWGLVVVRMS